MSRKAAGACLLACCFQLTNCGGRSALDSGEYLFGISTGGAGPWVTTTTMTGGTSLGFVVTASGGIESAGGAAPVTGGTTWALIFSGGASNVATSTGGASAAAGSSNSTGGLGATGGLSAAGGQTGTTACVSPTRSDRESLLDDLESGTGHIPNTNGRVGAWYSFNSLDGTLAQVPTPTAPGVPILPEQIPDTVYREAPCNNLAVHTSGAGYSWAGVGFDLKFDGTTYGSYDASSFTGATYFAAGAASEFSMRISTKATTSTKYGGTCTLDDEVASSGSDEGCQPHSATAYLDDDELSQHWVPFDELRLEDGEWDVAPDFIRSEITNVQFYAKGTFDFWLDNVSLYAGRPGCCELSPPECSGIIEFASADLKNSIGKGDLSCSDVCYRENFYAWSWSSTVPSSTQSLRGFQCLVGLRQLRIVGYALDDLEPIAGLTHLNQLTVSKGRISDLKALASLTRLKLVDLGENSISNLQPLAALKNLTTLTLSSNSVASIEALAQLQHLQSLNLASNQIVDVGPLSANTALQTLSLASNAVVDAGPLAGLTQLTALDLSDNHVKDVLPLSKLVSLDLLELKQNQITSLKGFGNLSKLPLLDLSDNQIGDLAGFGNMAALTTLVLSNNRLTSLSFGDLPKLASLTVANNSIDDLTQFGNLPELTFLDLSKNRISSLQTAGGLPKLTVLDLSDNQVRAVTGVATIGTIGNLYLSNNRIDDRSNLAELTQLGSLVSLKLDGNPIGTLENLPVLEHLTSLDLSNTGLSSVTELASMPNLTNIYLAGNQISEIGILPKLKKLNYLDLSDNQISELSVFVTAPWGPATYGERYANYPTLDLTGNPIDCAAQAANLAALRAMKLTVIIDCPWSS
jgi:Leucine-rich repeat (LRR) protein